MNKFDVLVVGGGFRSIVAAWGLARQGETVALVETGAKIGGFMSPINWDGHWIDKGPQFFDNFEPQDV
ncbi:MAG: NAD(P)-binding protein, partial [Boseongicola sp.]